MDVLSKAELEAMIAETTVDAYGEDEQVTGLYTMIEDNLAVIGILDLPLPTPAPDGAEWIEAYRHWAR